MDDPTAMPAGLPIPADDGAAAHVPGPVPRIAGQCSGLITKIVDAEQQAHPKERRRF
jgi:hypothetical protein